RNEAINITWLSTYINTSPARPAWAFMVDALINTLKPEGINNPNDVQTFLTSWTPPTRGPRTNCLPKEIITMLKMARKHNMCFAPIKLSQSLKRQLPAWLHLGALPRTYHKIKDLCLRQNHGVKSIKDLLNVSNRPTTAPQHWESHNCECELCASDRQAGCKNPNKCISTAAAIINNLAPKFNPFQCPINDELTLTHHRLEKNTRARTQ
ncbi:hypothetical protein DFH29DRAFT_814914, partial [Suillus ampliporus]